MTKEKINKVSFEIKWPYTLIALLTCMIGYHIHRSVAWGIFDFFLWPITWIKWLICHDVNVTIIKDTFSWFLK